MDQAADNRVFMLKAGGDLKAAARRLLGAVFGDRRPWAAAREVLIKPNAVNFEPHVHVDPAFIGSLVAAMREDGAGPVSVMESCTNGSFTRLVFEITGITREVTAAGGRCVYLDEGSSSTVELGESGRIETSRFVADRLLANRRDYFYVDVAKLKTHSMTTVTLCLKNQWCFVDPTHRGALHNDALHGSIREVNRLFVPDLCIVEGLVGTNHGHFPLKGFDGECLWNGGVLIAGRNAVATDAACCRLIGMDPAMVEHVAICARDSGTLDPPVTCLDPIDPPPAPFTDALLPFFPSDVVVHKGRERCCREGCYSNPVCAVQVLAANYGGHGGFHIFIGKGHDPAEVDACPAPVMVVGPCAQDEVYGRLAKRLGARKVRLSPGHNNLKETLRCLIPLMGVNILRISPLPLHRLAWAYLRHRLSGSRADIGFF